MLKKENFTEEHIRDLQSASHRDPLLLERSVYAFGLLEAITRVGMPFIFKGATCLMLLLERPMRLSTDIDIIVAPGTDLNTFIEEAGKIFPFVSVEEQVRKGKNNIEKRHFKFVYESPVMERSIYILLDVLFEDAKYKRLIAKPIKNELILTDGEDLTVQIPSVESILGDKLTAFAPHTTGILLNSNKDMEIIKQLYDVMTLIEVAEDFTEVRETYYSLVQDEIAYRGLDIGPGDALRDTYNAAVSIASRGKVSKEDYVSYLQGLRDVRSHIYVENFSAEEASKRVPVVMYLVACLLKNVPFEKDIDPAAYLGAGFISDELKALKSLRKVAPAGYACAVKADRLLNE